MLAKVRRKVTFEPGDVIVGQDGRGEALSVFICVHLWPI
jgi:hypothetical protein